MQQIIKVFKNYFHRPTKSVKSFSVTKFFIRAINISYIYKIILFK